MKSVMSSTEVDQIITTAVATINSSIPYNAQDERDTELANYFVAKRLVKLMAPRVDKYEKKAKEKIKGELEPANLVSDNYGRTCEYGTPRETFDKDAFIEAISKEFKIMKHKLVDIAANCMKTSAMPLSLNVEYIGEWKKQNEGN